MSVLDAVRLEAARVPVSLDWSKHGETELEAIHRENDRRFLRLLWAAMLDDLRAGARAA
jgi:hypothetical protein